MKMRRLIASFVCTFLCYSFSIAQCDHFSSADIHSDYAHHIDVAPNSCAQFSADGEQFYYINKDHKKVAILKIQLPSAGHATFNYLAELSQDKALKLTAIDILYIERALEQWQSEKMKLGFTATATGLEYKINEEGSGKFPEAGKEVSVHYKGYLEDGTVFDNSFGRGEPISFPLGTGRVIAGWDEGIQLFKVGSKGTLRIPAELGYGSRGAPPAIPPNATLYFDIEVVSAAD